MRTITAGFRDDIESANSEDVTIFFAIVSHPWLETPFYVNSDIVDYVLDGITYFGAAFSISFISDDDQPPSAKVAIQNVDRRIGEALADITDAPQIAIQLYTKSDFTDSVPRQPIGTPISEYNAPLMFLRNIQWDAGQFTADLVSYDLTTEPWPAIRTTPDVTPALFR